jgi:hypothetical protein
MAAKLDVQHHLTKRLLNHIGDKDDTDEYIIISTEHLRAPMEMINRRFLELMDADPAHWGKHSDYRANYRAITLEEVLETYFKAKKLSKHSVRWLLLPVPWR